MYPRLQTSLAAAFAIVPIVLPVSGFAQTDSRMRSMLVRSSETVARPYVAAHDPAYELTPLPPNLIVADVYRPVVEMMRQRSATFRRQCLRIAGAPQLLVVIESDPPRASARPLAISRISRFAYGRMAASVRVTLSTRTPELIAHELEHVLEQLDGVDLAAKARVASSGVRECECGDVSAFETTRAVVTGVRVADEVARD